MIYKTYLSSGCGGKNHEMRQTENVLDVQNIRRKVLFCPLYNRQPESEVSHYTELAEIFQTIFWRIL